MTDRLFDALFFEPDWWAQLGAALAWENVARLVEGVDPGAARLAWGYAARSYGLYMEAYDAHAPASRWDPSYGSECAAAEERVRALPERRPSSALPDWVGMALERQFSEALLQVKHPPQSEVERAVLAVLALACRCADRIVEAERLEAWSKGN